MEIIISGAFPDCNETTNQTLTDALLIFSEAILKNGYTLTFGSHPTFQELFFKLSNKNNLKMFISKWFENYYEQSKKHFCDNAELIETDSQNSLSESLTLMRKSMIQRKEVSALLCLGGKIKKENEPDEGIREEINLALDYGIPVFVVGAVGGCSSKVAIEFQNNKDVKLNEASVKLNKEFMESTDFFMLSQKMLEHLDRRNNC